MPQEVPSLSEEGKARIESVLDKAASDADFRRRLLDDTEAALQDVELTDEERSVLLEMRRVKLEEWGIDIRRFRGWLRDNGAKVSPLTVAITERMSGPALPEISSAGKDRIAEVLNRAADDIEFRRALLENSSEALANTELTEEELEALSSLRRVKLEEMGIDIRRFRGWLRDNGAKVQAWNIALAQRLEGQ